VTLVVGIGNRTRGDDGVGPYVAERVAALHLPGVEVVVEADPLELLDLLDKPGALVVLDAVAPRGEPGRVTVWPVDELPGPRGSGQPSGTHGLGVLETLALARALGRLRARVVVVGVEAASDQPGAAISSAVRAGLDDAVEAVRAAVADGP
jgi:hydrogenase maturation protease